MTNVVVVRPRVQLSQVSAISAMQIWYWVLVILSIFIFIWVKKRFNLSLETLITYILYFGIALNITFVAAANNLALSKVPLPPGDIRGDNGELLLGMMRAQETGWAGGYYPPVWLTLVGTIARITNNSVLEIWKPVYLLSVVLLPGLVLLAWRQAFNPLAAAAITFLLTFGTIEWKGIAHLVMTAMFIAIVYEISKKQDLDFKFNSKLFLYGLFFGLSSLTYFGYLWWSLIAIGVLVFALWFNSKREYLLTKVIDAGLGFALIFGPSQVASRYDLLLKGDPANRRNFLDELLIGLSGIAFLLLVLLIIALRFVPQKHSFLNKTLAYSTGLIAPAVVVFTLLTNRTYDTWFEPYMEINPTPNLGLGFNTTGTFFTLITLIGLILAFNETRFRSAILVLSITFISAALMMFWFAAEMEITRNIELFPRAGGNFSLAWNILTFIGLFAILTSSYFYEFIKYIWPKDLSRLNTIILTLVLILPIAAIHARTLSEAQDGIFPIGENSVWQAYRACDNPHEDPMLAKVFEERPFIQKYLRENCPKVDWPVIPAGNWVPVYPGTYAN